MVPDRSRRARERVQRGDVLSVSGSTEKHSTTGSLAINLENVQEKEEDEEGDVEDARGLQDTVSREAEYG